MTRWRWIVFIVLGALSCGWAGSTLYVQIVRLEHWSLVKSIRANSGSLDDATLDAALADYAQALRWAPCNSVMHHDRVLLWAQKSDMALTKNDEPAYARALEKTQNALMALLACTPHDGKAWLDLAVITAHREGFTNTVLAQYKMSATVAPKESWLAQQRLLFALAFKPLLDAPALAVAQNDLDVLARAHPNRMHAVMHAAQVKTEEDLKALFVPIK